MSDQLSARPGTPVLVMESLCKSFVASSRAPTSEALSQVSFEVRDGECLGIVGESGSGKTTLARIIAGLLDATTGTTTFRGTPIDTRALRRNRHLRREIQIVFQNPVASLNPRRTVEQALGVPLKNFKGLSGGAASARMTELLDSVGLSQGLLRRYPHEISGGQCQRVVIARALAADPTVLILDEAVSSLDALTALHLLDLLTQLRDERGLTYLFITHDLGIVKDFTDRMIVLNRGFLVEEGSTTAICAQPHHEYTRELFAASECVVFGEQHQPNNTITTTAR